MHGTMSLKKAFCFRIGGKSYSSSGLFSKPSWWRFFKSHNGAIYLCLSTMIQRPSQGVEADFHEFLTSEKPHWY